MQLFEWLQAPWYQSSLLPTVLLFIRICTAVATMGWDTKHILPAFRLFTMQVNVTYEFSPPQWADKSYSRGHILDVY